MMFIHLLKPIWKRKSRNLMLSLEILLAFVVVFVVVAIAGRYFQLYQLPTGFSYDSVWSVNIQADDAMNHEGLKADTGIYDRIKRGLMAMPEVQDVAFSIFSPYEMSTFRSDYYLPESGHSFESHLMEVSDDFFDVLNMPIVRGRWFSSQDEGAQQAPVVISQSLADSMFPGQDPLGKLISDSGPGKSDRKMMKVVGIFEAFRNQGELMPPKHFLFTRFSAQTSKRMPATLLLKLKPGTSPAFEAKLSQQLKLLRNDWGYQITSLRDLRQALLFELTLPLLVLSVIAAFLLLMVAFGLFGVLWQNTTQRIPELGLRRAVGASAMSIYRQIIVEQLLLSSLAMVVGVLLLLQLPITGVLGDYLNWPLFLSAIVVSMTLIYLVSVLCALYPAWMASRLSPTDALHYE